MSSVLKQFLATISCNLLSAAYGSASAWGGPNYLVLISEKSPFELPLSNVEASLVVSIPCFGAIIGTFIYSMIIDRFSRKSLLVSIAVPQILSWVMILLASNVYHLYVARLIAGIAGSAAFITIPVFVCEIADDKVRGTLGSMMILTCNAGVLFGYVISLYFDYFEQIKINLMIPILFLVSFYYIPETPEFLLKRNRNDAAEKSLQFYKNKRVTEVRKADEVEKTYEKIENDTTKLSFSDFSSRSARKAVMIALFLGALNQFCGAFTLICYTNKIFKESGSTLSEDASSVIVATVQLLANCLTLILVDRLGRKILVTISSVGTAMGLVSMAVYDIYKVQLYNHRWIPVVSFSTTIFMASIGMLPLTFVLLSEILPRKIKNIMTLLSLEVAWLLSFVLVSCYPMITEAIGSYTIEFMFSICCIIGTIFNLAVLPETSGKTYEEIMKELEK